MTTNQTSRTSKDIRSDVLAVYVAALAEGKAATLKVANANDFTLSYGDKVFRHAYTGSATFLGTTLRSLRQEGLWNDKVSHGRWESALYHGAGETTTNAAKRTTIVVQEPEPEPEPEQPKTKAEVLESLQAKLTAAEAEVAKLKAEVAQAVKDAQAELEQAIAEEEKALADAQAKLAAKRALLQPKVPESAKPVAVAAGKPVVK